MNKQEALQEVFWLGSRILDNDYEEAERSITDLREYIESVYNRRNEG